MTISASCTETISSNSKGRGVCWTIYVFALRQQILRLKNTQDQAYADCCSAVGHLCSEFMRILRSSRHSRHGVFVWRQWWMLSEDNDTTEQRAVWTWAGNSEPLQVGTDCPLKKFRDFLNDKTMESFWDENIYSTLFTYVNVVWWKDSIKV